MQDNVCLVIDLEGFYVQGVFKPRELGYHSWRGDAGRQAFFQRVKYRDLCPKDRKTVGVVRCKIHGLSYQPTAAEDPTHPRNLRSLLRRLYWEFATEHRTVVDYKGGTVEKTLLLDSGLPGLNLESLGCPKYDELRGQDLLRDKREDLLPSCGFHADPTLHHCPVIECHAFWLWYQHAMSHILKEHLLLSYQPKSMYMLSLKSQKSFFSCRSTSQRPPRERDPTTVPAALPRPREGGFPKFFPHSFFIPLPPSLFLSKDKQQPHFFSHITKPQQVLYRLPQLILQPRPRLPHHHVVLPFPHCLLERSLAFFDPLDHGVEFPSARI